MLDEAWANYGPGARGGSLRFLVRPAQLKEILNPARNTFSCNYHNFLLDGTYTLDIYIGVAYYSTIALYSFTPHTFCQDEQSEETESRQKNRVFKLADDKIFLNRHDQLLCACYGIDCSSF